MFETDSQQQASRVAAGAESTRVWELFDQAVAAAPGRTLREKRFLFHVAELAAADPPIAVHWMPARSTARSLTSGEAYWHRRAIVVPRIADGNDYLTALHEVGHVRDRQRGTTLEREIHAWRFALRESLQWGPGESAFMERCLMSHVKAEAEKKLPDTIGVLAVERFLADASKVNGRTPTAEQYDDFERQLFQRRYGSKRCTARICTEPGAWAIELVGSTFACPRCRPLIAARMDIRRRVRDYAAENAALDDELARLLRCRELATVKVQVRERDRRAYLAALMEGDEMRTKPNQERAVAMGRDATRNNTLLRVIDPLIELAKGELRCHTCGRPATSVRRIDGSHSRGICDEPTCRTAADLDHQMHVLKQQRRGRTA